MKKLFLILIFLLFSVCVFAQNINLENKYMSLSFENKDGFLHLTEILDKESGVNFIKEAFSQSYIWELQVKKIGDYSGDPIKLYSKNATSMEYTLDEKSGKLALIWKDVKNSSMTSGFDVTVTVELKDNNSYWKINVGENKEYGIWSVIFPNVNDLNAVTGDMIMFPHYSAGFPITEFTENGFNSPWGHKKTDPRYYLKEVGQINPCNFRYTSFTKENSTLYMCVEDLDFSYKTYHIKMYTPNHVAIDVWNYPENVLTGESYSPNYSFNLSVMEGDWFDAGKRYRQWSIDTKSPAFARGTIDERKDIPQWLKDNVCWTRWHGDTYGFDPYKGLESIVKTKELLDVPMACHLYGWSKYDYDTHYPNWLPAKDYLPEIIDKMKKAGLKVMPYTNGNLVDMALSPTYKEFGKDLLALDEKGQPYREAWSKELGADNACGCPGSDIYFREYMNECVKAMKKYNFDAWYIDQVGGIGQKLCFNPTHKHGKGGGDIYVKEYQKFVAELKAKLSEIKGDIVPISTEDAAESIPFDMYLRLSDAMAENTDYPLGSVVFSGYEINFGTMCDSPEFSKSEGYGAVNRLACAFVNGNQVGWNTGGDDEPFKFPVLGEYYKNLAKAREFGIKYFNLGEYVRKVNITSDIPTVNLEWHHHSGISDFDFPVVKTGSFFYKGKTMIAFTNISKTENVNVAWNSDYKSLYLKKKGSYKVTEVYPKTKKPSFGSKISGKFTIEPLQTKLFIVE